MRTSVVVIHIRTAAFYISGDMCNPFIAGIEGNYNTISPMLAFSMLLN